MKKTIIALAVAGLSFNAFAVDVDAAAKDQVPTKYAKEQTLGADSLVKLTAKIVDVKAGFALTTPYVRFDLDNGATFKGNPELEGKTAAQKGLGDWSLASGGDGQSFAIFNIAEGTTSTQALELTLASAGGIKVANKNDVKVTYNIFETASNAVNNINSLVTGKSATLLTFTDVLAVAAKQATDLKKIDITSPSDGKKFDNATGTNVVTNFADLILTVNTGVVKLDGTAISNISDVVTSGTWSLEGNFSAPVTQVNTGFTIAGDKQSASLVVAGVGSVTSTTNTTLTVDGATAIKEGGYTAKYVVNTPAANFTFAPYVFNNAVVLKKNGSTAEVDLALKPGGAYKNFIRISNKTSKAGAATINVIDDAGNGYSTTLGAVLGADKAELPAQGSTDQIAIDTIAAAAGVPAGYEGKLRLVIDAQVPVQAGLNTITSVATDSTLTATTTSTDVVSGIAVQSYAVNTNNGVLTLLK